MKIPEPKRWWFPKALLIAMLFQGLIIFTLCSIGVVVNADPSDEIHPQTFLYLAGAIASIGTIAFPIGLCGVLVWSGNILRNHFALFVGTGWIAYLTVVGVGIMKPRKLLFLALMIMLILNIGGCWLPHAADSIELWQGD